jgi:hypothetical protein
MAVRDRNLFAWQAYVITMSLVSVIVLVGTYLLWADWSNQTKINAQLRDDLSKAQAEVRTGTTRVSMLKGMLGYGGESAENLDAMAAQLSGDAELQEVVKNYGEDMKLFDPNQAKKDYRQLPIFLLDTVRERNAQIDRARAAEQKLMADHAAVVDRETKARQQAVQEKDKAERDLAAARNEHTEKIADLNKQKQAVSDQLAKFKADHEVKSRKLEEDLARLTDENAKQKRTIQEQAEQIVALKKEDFEEPAGYVINVAQGGRTVWVNVGSEDGLREGVPFTVLESSTLNVSEAKPKAEMIVEEVTEAHMARARVISENYRNPVLPGDIVYSPAWRKGRKLSFALVGKMDLNGDGYDDREMVREIIRKAGGEVDAEILPDGRRVGNGLSVRTHKIVIGSDVGLSENASSDQANRNRQYAQFVSEAKTFGIQQISLENMMGYLKSRNDGRTIPLGSQAKATDFPLESRSGTLPSSTGAVSDLYKPRRPAN